MPVVLRLSYIYIYIYSIYINIHIFNCLCNVCIYVFSCFVFFDFFACFKIFRGVSLKWVPKYELKDYIYSICLEGAGAPSMHGQATCMLAQKNILVPPLRVLQREGPDREKRLVRTATHFHRHRARALGVRG